MGLLNDIIKAIEKPEQPAGKWVNGKFIPAQHNASSVPYSAPLQGSLSFYVAGVNYRMDNVMKLATPMKKWNMTNEQIWQKYGNKRIYRYFFTNEPLQFVPEPNNPHDSNAIKIMINNLHVGYVPQEYCNMVKNMFSGGRCFAKAQFSGGEFKVITGNGEVYKDTESITIKIIIDKE